MVALLKHVTLRISARSLNCLSGILLSLILYQEVFNCFVASREPRMFEALFRRKSHSRIIMKHFHEKVYAQWTNSVFQGPGNLRGVAVSIPR